jgi:cytochrome c-type biogenesis protein CcmE
MTTRRRRIVIVLMGVSGVAAAVWLALGAFNDNLVFFFSPSQVVAGDAPVTRRLRVGGLVEEGSLERDADGLTARFTITDTVHRIQVIYTGILPDLFKEGRGCVAQGQVGPDGVLRADLVLAKHDENYMPIEAAEAIEDARRSSMRTGATLLEP